MYIPRIRYALTLRDNGKDVGIYDGAKKPRKKCSRSIYAVRQEIMENQCNNKKQCVCATKIQGEVMHAYCCMPLSTFCYMYTYLHGFWH